MYIATGQEHLKYKKYNPYKEEAAFAVTSLSFFLSVILQFVIAIGERERTDKAKEIVLRTYKFL